MYCNVADSAILQTVAKTHTEALSFVFLLVWFCTMVVSIRISPRSKSDHMSFTYRAPASDQGVYTPQRHRSALTGNKQPRATTAMGKLYDDGYKQWCAGRVLEWMRVTGVRDDNISSSDENETSEASSILARIPVGWNNSSIEKLYFLYGTGSVDRVLLIALERLHSCVNVQVCPSWFESNFMTKKVMI